MEDDTQSVPRYYRFEPFELDVRERELRKGGTRIRLGDQAFEILRMLIERRGATLMRDEIQLRLWPNDTVVEFDLSINAAVRQLRVALRDSADNPRYVETVARRGYRFLVDVEQVRAAPDIEEEPLDPQNLGARTIGHFRIIEKLGSGGMGVVYRAENLKLGRQVALKFLPFPVKDLPERIRERFQREARALAALNHPHICAVLGLEEISGQPVMEMELVEGETLYSRLKRGSMSSAEALPMVTQVAGALAEAHRKGIVHRDLKPANIMLTHTGVKLLDFGLVKVASASVASDEAATAEGAVLGTFHYMSPEQAQGKETDSRSDIFALGAVLYETLTGEKAFPAGAIAALLQRAPPSLMAASPGLQSILKRCLAQNPNDRWQSAGDLKASLEALAESSSPGEAVVAALTPVAAVRRVRPVWMIAAAGIMLASVG